MSRAKCTFVISSDNQLGIGKLVSLDAVEAVIVYFRSPVDEAPIRKVVAAASVSQKILHPETRAYFKNPETDGFEVGRVLHYQQEDALYLVRFPNNQPRMLSCDEFDVRCRIPIREPAEQLASQVNETAFWHAARSGFVKHLLEQHRQSAGLSALLSSSVEIVAHQASVIQRVLMDPFQRYLLADEVGLGKTIEAGVLIKQFVLDDPDDHQTLVIVPESLLAQWHQELIHRFHLSRYLGKTIQLISSRDRNAIDKLAKAARMIVVDEAHHLSSWAWSSSPEERSIYDLVAEATSEISRRVLLLSATPVLHNEKSFLAMLHLLDPQVYSLDGLVEFKRRIQMRQEIAERVADLREDEQNYFLADTLDALGELLADDQEFHYLRRTLACLIDDDVDEDDKQRIALIRAMRSHVSDMWRLNRRILRSRRTVTSSAYLPGRAGAKRIVYSCGFEAGLCEAIEDWRLTLARDLYSVSENEKRIAGQLALKMDELAACEPSKASAFAEQRLAQVTENGDCLDVSEDEAEALAQIVHAAEKCDLTARLNKLYEMIGASGEDDSFVVFCDRPKTADRIFRVLSRRLATGRVLRHASCQSSWTQFKNEKRGYVLVCDRTAEEGLNLQKRGARAIHFDLPFSPNRIEQRMGRLDRFGSGTPVQAAVLVCDNSKTQKRWFQLLDGALGVFERSIAILQYVIDQEMTLITEAFLDLGSECFVEAQRKLGGDEGLVGKELRRIRAQDALDSFDADDLSQEFVDKLEDADRNLGKAASTAFQNWLVRNLRFRRTGEEERFDDVLTYEFTRRVDYGVKKPFGRDTLLPADEFQRRFCESLDDVDLDPPAQYTTVPVTFDRVTSQHRACRLLRVGDPFVDAFANLMRWDDRGVSYAFWRYRPSTELEEDVALFFRFEFVLSVGSGSLKALCEQYPGYNRGALIRRSQVIMPPRFTGMWLDADLERVMDQDPRMLLLKSGFNKAWTGSGTDFNLNRNRWEAAASVYDMSLWRDRCLAGREKAEQLLRTQSKLPELSQQCIETATQRSNRVQQQLRSRMALLADELRKPLELDLKFEVDLLAAQKEAFGNPDLRVDSVGAVFVSNQNPFVGLEEGEDGE